MSVKEFFTGAATMLVIPLFLGACAQDHPPNQAPASRTVPKKKVLRVKAITLEPGVFIQRLTLVASAKASREVVIAPEVSGRVAKVEFDKGEKAVAGQPLVRLDAAKLEADIAQAEADKDLVELDYKKLKALADRRASVSEFQLEQARLKLKAAEARVAGLRVILEKHVVRAPFNGLIASKSVERGAFIATGQPLARLVSISPIKLAAGAPETAISDFAIGKEASIVFDAYPDWMSRGKVTYIAPEVDSRSRTFDMELELPNRDMKIFPEMSAKVTFIRKTVENSILIPQDSIVELADGHAVFVIEEGNVARLRKVEIKDMAEEMALVGSGLAAGDRLIVIGQRNLIDGDRVKIID